MNRETRGNCLPCRLRKCLVVGMDPQMIRCPPKQRTTTATTMPKVNEVILPMVRSFSPRIHIHRPFSFLLSSLDRSAFSETTVPRSPQTNGIFSPTSYEPTTSTASSFAFAASSTRKPRCRPSCAPSPSTRSVSSASLSKSSCRSCSARHISTRCRPALGKPSARTTCFSRAA